METRDLRYFMQIADLGSVHAAAERVGRTQPALTKSIKRLEAELGGKLFTRGGRNILLTHLGRDLLKYGRMICRTMDSTIEDLRLAAQGKRGQVKIGISPTSAQSLLPGAIEGVARELPDLTYQILTGTPDILRNALRTRQVDVVIGPTLDTDRQNFETYFIQHDDVVVAAGPNHPLAGKPATLAELCSYDWVLPVGSVQTRSWLDERFRKANLRVSIKLEASSVFTMLPVVRRNNLLTFISINDTYYGDTELLCRVHCDEATLRREISLLYLRDIPLSPAVINFVRCFRELSASAIALPPG